MFFTGHSHQTKFRLYSKKFFGITHVHVQVHVKLDKIQDIYTFIFVICSKY